MQCPMVCLLLVEDIHKRTRRKVPKWEPVSGKPLKDPHNCISLSISNGCIECQLSKSSLRKIKVKCIGDYRGKPVFSIPGAPRNTGHDGHLYFYVNSRRYCFGNSDIRFSSWLLFPSFVWILIWMSPASLTLICRCLQGFMVF